MTILDDGEIKVSKEREQRTGWNEPSTTLHSSISMSPILLTNTISIHSALHMFCTYRTQYPSYDISLATQMYGTNNRTYTLVGGVSNTCQVRLWQSCWQKTVSHTSLNSHQVRVKSRSPTQMIMQVKLECSAKQ